MGAGAGTTLELAGRDAHHAAEGGCEMGLVAKSDFERNVRNVRPIAPEEQLGTIDSLVEHELMRSESDVLSEQL